MIEEGEKKEVREREKKRERKRKRERKFSVCWLTHQMLCNSLEWSH